jgi:hypothetical protein
VNAAHEKSVASGEWPVVSFADELQKNKVCQSRFGNPCRECGLGQNLTPLRFLMWLPGRRRRRELAGHGELVNAEPQKNLLAATQMLLSTTEFLLALPLVRWSWPLK